MLLTFGGKQMIPIWSPKAMKAKPIFYRQWNDIDIYIEDTGVPSKKLFRHLFTRCFSDKYRVAEVFPLGGRKAVINACEDDQLDGGRPRIYIIDADLDLLLNTKLAALKRFFCLPIYCIENLLIDEKAIIEVLYEEHSVLEKEELVQNFDFKTWISLIEKPLVDLFIDYAICKEVLPSQETVSFKISNLVSSGDGLLDVNKIKKRLEYIESQICCVITPEELNKRKQIIKSSLIVRKINSVQTVVSGKHYLLPLMRIRMNQIAKLRVTKDVLNLRLAKYCDISPILPICSVCSLETKVA
jgi:hypothetical protein